MFFYNVPDNILEEDDEADPEYVAADKVPGIKGKFFEIIVHTFRSINCHFVLFQLTRKSYVMLIFRKKKLTI